MGGCSGATSAGLAPAASDGAAAGADAGVGAGVGPFFVVGARRPLVGGGGAGGGGALAWGSSGAERTAVVGTTATPALGSTSRAGTWPSGLKSTPATTGGGGGVVVAPRRPRRGGGGGPGMMVTGIWSAVGRDEARPIPVASNGFRKRKVIRSLSPISS